jgi:carbonic anhydrase
MSVINQMLEANARYANGFDRGELASPPARRVAVVSCMDARLIPARFLGLEEGDAHVIANAGGRAQDALRSLVVSQRLLGTNEVVIVQHTDCGMGKYSDSDIRSKVMDDLGADAGDMAFLTFSDVRESVREDVELLRGSPLIARDVTVRGFVYDVKTGRLSEISV